MRRKQVSGFFQGMTVITILGFVTGCGGGGGGGTPPTPPTVTGASFFFDVGIAVPSGIQLQATGTGPFKWTSVGLPAGLVLSEDGTISGTPSVAGQATVKVTATGPGGADDEDIVIGVLGRGQRASQDINGVAGNASSGDGSINGQLRSLDPGLSGDGRYVVFDSAATNLIPGATSNGKRHIYLKDRLLGTIELISKSTQGAEGNNDSHVAVVSDDGRFVAFDSFASNLVDNDDPDNTRDVFLRDRKEGKTIRISQKLDGSRPCPNGPNENCNSFDPSMDKDGNIIAFGTYATLLSPQDDNTSLSGSDIYLFNRATGTLTLVTKGIGGPSNGASGSGSPAVSADGRFVAFASPSSNLVLNDPDPSTVEDDIFAYNVISGQIVKVSVTNNAPGVPNGVSQNPSISGDGSRIAFTSTATNLLAGDPSPTRDVFITDWQQNPGVYLLRLGGDANSDFASLSRDGRFVTLHSLATNFAGATSNPGGQQQIYVVDIAQLSPKMVSVNPGGNPGNGTSRFPVISGDGRFIAFYSSASDLVAGDSGTFDAFVFQRP